MIYASVDELLHMNGHGGYVWVSYGVTVLALLWLAASPLLRRRRLLADIARRARRDAASGGSTNRQEGE
ncbi:MAG: heme exporter protein CcmD [Gammaproteobacteria bacterium]